MEVLNHLVLRGRAGVLGIVNADDDQLGNENAVNDQCRVAGNSIGPMHKFSQHYVSDFERSTIITAGDPRKADFSAFAFFSIFP